MREPTRLHGLGDWRSHFPSKSGRSGGEFRHDASKLHVDDHDGSGRYHDYIDILIEPIHLGPVGHFHRDSDGGSWNTDRNGNVHGWRRGDWKRSA